MGSVTVLAVVIGVVSLGWAFFRDPYATSSCKGVGISQSLDSLPPPPGAHSDEEAVRSFVAAASPNNFGLSKSPFPKDGWKADRGRWVSDVDGGFYSMSVTNTDNGWLITGISFCTR
jgi:hypothetical protein